MPNDTQSTTRAGANTKAAKLAADIRRFMAKSDQFISLSRRYTITAALLELEALADGR